MKLRGAHTPAADALHDEKDGRWCVGAFTTAWQADLQPNATEGSQLSEEQTRLIFETATVGKRVQSDTRGKPLPRH